MFNAGNDRGGFERRDFNDRGGRDFADRGDRPARRMPSLEPRPPGDNPDVEMERYRVDVGAHHGVKPGQIVGAIANEANIESRFIGNIDIADDFSTVDLPKGMSAEVLEVIKKARVCQRPLQISRYTEVPAATLLPVRLVVIVRSVATVLSTRIAVRRVTVPLTRIAVKAVSTRVANSVASAAIAKP